MASATIPAKSLGMVVAGLIIPSLHNHYTTRKLFVVTQVLSFALMCLLLVALNSDLQGSWFFIGITFFQTLFKQVFDSAREYASKKIGTLTTHRSIQAQLLQGFYGAQFIGPILSFILIRYYGTKIPIFLDACSFAVASILSFWLPNEVIRTKTHSILNPLKYLFVSNSLRNIFFLRTIGYWLPVGIFNYLVFSIVQDHYNLTVENSAWVYTAIGFGSLIASVILKRENWKWISIHKIDDQFVAFGALLILAVTRIGFINLPSFSMAMAILVIGGICNGLNATATQSLRRKFTTNTQFPEIVGLELIVGRFVDWAVSALCMTLMLNKVVSYNQAIWFSVGALVIVATLHLSPSLASVKADIQ